MRAFAVAAAVLSALALVADLDRATARRPARVKGSPSCKGAEQVPKNLSKFRKLVVCLHNSERGKHGLEPLRSDSHLSKAARVHARNMVRRRFFDHVSPDGDTPSDRVKLTGYGRGKSFRTGENILFYGPQFPTPEQAVGMWMNSAGHRRNILRHEWRDLGLGAAAGSPFGGEGLTVAAVFAVQSP